MALELEGGCLVAGIREGEPVRSGNLQIWSRFRGDAISMRVLKIDGKATIRNDDGDEVLYVLERGEGIHLPSGSETKLDGSLTVVSVSHTTLGTQESQRAFASPTSRSSTPPTAGTAS